MWQADEHPNVELYRRMIRAFNENDLSVVAEIVAADLHYVIPGKSPIAAETNSVAEHLAALRRAKELSHGTLRLEPRAVAANADYLFVWGRITAQRNGKKLDSEHCVMYRFANGKIVQGRTVPIDLYAFDEFWA